MAGIMVFLPGPGGSDPNELSARGLGSLLDPVGVTPIFTETNSGPDGGSGRLVTFYSTAFPATPREYEGDAQTWKPAPPDGELPASRYWLGYVNNEIPSAGDLQRARPADGVPVLLADGNSWVIPIAEWMPQRLALDPKTGDEIRVPKDEHREFAARSNEMFRLFMSDGFHSALEKDGRATIPRGLSFAALALSKNYRVNREVVDLLGLVGEVEVFEIIQAATGLKLLAELMAQKKSTEAATQETKSS